MSQKWTREGIGTSRASGKVSAGILAQYRSGRFLTSSNQEMAEYLQDEISKAIDRSIFNPDRYPQARPLHGSSHAYCWLELKRLGLAHKTAAVCKPYIKNGSGNSPYL